MRLLDEFVQDARYAIRCMTRNPGFTAVVLLTLALGIGANTAIFSVLYGVCLSPVKYSNPERLVDVSMQQVSGRRFMGGTSYLNLADWKAQARTVEVFGVHRYTREVNVTGTEGAEAVIGHRVSANLFQILGEHPVLGHPLASDADRSAGPRQVLIGHAWWKQRFGAAPGVVGRRIQVDNETFTIAGVMAPGFEFPPMGSKAYRPVMWMSLNLPPEQENAREAHALSVIARLKTGVSMHQTQAEMDTIAARLVNAYPSENGGWGIKVGRLTEDRQSDAVRPSLLLVMAAATLVLLIACANIANLLVARAVGREHEFAVRRALGVSWHRLARQLLTESGLLSLCGGAVGMLLAYFTLPLLKSMLPPTMPRADEIGVNGAVLAFGATVSFMTALLFGLIPALQPRSSIGMGSGGRTISAGNRTARLLVTAEVALALVLLAGAGLLIESFRRATNVDLGFQKEHVLTMRLQLTKGRYPDGMRVAAFRSELLRRAQALPGVRCAGTVSSLPMGIIMQGTEFEIEGRSETSHAKPFVDFANVSQDYLRAMGVPLLRGRYFDAGDRSGSPQVVVISEGVARAHWPDGEALGSRIRLHDTWFQIVGVVKDVRQYSPESGPRGGTIYALNQQLPLANQGNAMGRLMVLVMRTEAEPGLIVGAMRREIAEIDKDQPVADVTTMEQLVSRALAPRRLNTVLVSLFAAVALLLAAVGIFGVVSYSVARRTKEIGIRMALGAQPARVLSMVAKETLAFGAAGAAFGVATTLACSRLIRGFLYGVKPTDPIILGVMALSMLLAVALAGLLPARRAMRVDPVVALREG